MGRTRAIRQVGDEASPVIIQAKRDLEALVPRAIEAYEELLESSPPPIRRQAAKDVLDAVQLTGVQGPAVQEGLGSEAVIKLVTEMGKIFGVAARDVEEVPMPSRIKRVKPVVSKELVSKMEKGR